MLVWLLPISAVILYVVCEIRIRRKTKVLELIRESVQISHQITKCIWENVKDGLLVSILNHPELEVLFKKDQELYDRIIKLDPKWGNTIIPPFEMHKHLIELAQGKYKQTH